MKKIFFLFIILLTISCGKKETYRQENLVVDASNKQKRSTTAGNLISSAIRREYDLDVVLYPNTLLSNNHSIFSESNPLKDVDRLMTLYPDGEKDEFILGNMTGKDIKTLIFQRSLERFGVELDVAGMSYDLIFKGGQLLSQSYAQENGKQLQDEKIYFVAISKHFYFSGDTFPSYMYRNSIERIFKETDKIISARSSLRAYLKKQKVFPLLNKIRAQVKKVQLPGIKKRSISQIQGDGHLSSYLGQKINTSGVITALAETDVYPYGYQAFIQSLKPDSNPKTSEALRLNLPKDFKVNFKVGDVVEVTGVVYEETNHIENGLTATTIRDIDKIKIIDIKNKLPKPIHVGAKGRSLPEKYYSTYNGNLNFKPSLNLNDGLDFWESVEHMRISFSEAKVLGFRGGKEQSDDKKSHLTLFLLPDGNKSRSDRSAGGGLLATPDHEDFNPQIIPYMSSPFTKGLDLNSIYKVGDIIEGEITGIITFYKNIFGDGEFGFVTPKEQDSLDQFYNRTARRQMSPLAERPKAPAAISEDLLSIAAYNVKNLSPVNKQRIIDTGKMIKTNLSCPDILGLVELQDNNGETYQGGSYADDTISELIKNIDCPFKYGSANIDPLLHREGGIPGGNIRVAIIYNKDKLGFVEKELPGPMEETLVQRDGHLNYNPGRVMPNHPAFKNTRKSIIAEFLYKGRSVFVIVNHFNSKLSDPSHYSFMQPILRRSEQKRARVAKAINYYVQRIEKQNPESLIAVIGDFNAYVNETPMKFLEGDELFNLIRNIPRNRWYTTNHNGNSQSLDYIFVNNNLKKNMHFFDILHVNSDYMGRLSDHDPLISIFKIQ